MKPTLFDIQRGEYYQTDWQEYFNDIIDLIPPNSSVLDAGCGRGELLDYLRREKNCSVRGIDLSEDAIKICQSKGIDVIKCDLDKDPIEGTYDIIIFSSSLESLVDPVGVLKRIRKNLHKNGNLIVWVPNISFWPYRIQFLFGRNLKCYGASPEDRKLGIMGYDDIQFFNKPSLSNVLIKAGYRPVKWVFRKPTLSIRPKLLLEYLVYRAVREKVPDLFSPFLLVKALKISDGVIGIE
ncbi:MAG: methyltransferase domain-containing protein [Candidatus Marinimicrobia bacterium]|nr:methyltransferase domain-containing protein [Candidatus Neomarinimicrobiota bacterium]